MSVKRTPAGGYEISVSVNYRRVHRRLPAGTPSSEAKRVEAELRAALGQRRSPVVPGDPRLTDLMALYAAHCGRLRSPDTARHHANRIGEWVEGFTASQARACAAGIVEDLSGHYAPATINRSLGALKKALGMAWENGQTPVDYSSLVKRLPENNQREVFLSLEQVRKIADAASENVRAAIWIAILTGCRRGEVCKIKHEDIGDDSITLPAGNTKTLRYRSVPITPALRPWLKYLPLPINYEGVKSGFQRARTKVDMEYVNFHDLRHACATILLKSGANLLTISKILGHTSTKTTERYSHQETSVQRAALEKAFTSVSPTKRKRLVKRV